MPLPTQISQKIVDPQLLSVVIYGGPGIGKSTFCSLADSVVFLPTEPGLNAISGYKWKDEKGNDKLIESWEELWSAYVELRNGKHSYKTVCIDTGNNAFKLCQNYICRQNGKVQHETDIPGNSKGYTLVNNEFYRLMKSFAGLPMGFFVTFHTREIEVKTKTQIWSKTVPELPDKSRGQMVALADFVLYLETEEFEDEQTSTKKTRRLMHSQPHTLYEAKYRYKPLPDPIVISGKNSYQEFIIEFKRANGIQDGPQKAAHKK